MKWELPGSGRSWGWKHQSSVLLLGTCGGQVGGTVQADLQICGPWPASHGMLHKEHSWRIVTANNHLPMTDTREAFISFIKIGENSLAVTQKVKHSVAF